MKKFTLIMATVLVVILSIGLLIGCTEKEEYQDYVNLEAGSDSLLKTLILTDVCFDGTQNDETRKTMISKMVTKKQPELIIINGNMVDTEDNGVAMQSFADFMDSLKVYWAPVLGEKDLKGKADRTQIEKILKKANFSVYMKGINAGEGSYLINIKNTKNKVICSLMMFDTAQVIKAEQIEWYKNTMKTISIENADKIGNNITNYVFSNKPIKEFLNASENLDASNPNFITGKKRQDITTLGDDVKIFSVMQEVGAVGVFAGYDTLNDFQAKYKSTTFAYINSMYLSDVKEQADINGGLFASFSSNKNPTINVVKYKSL